jgi:hypothetical protein
MSQPILREFSSATVRLEKAVCGALTLPRARLDAVYLLCNILIRTKSALSATKLTHPKELSGLLGVSGRVECWAFP